MKKRLRTSSFRSRGPSAQPHLCSLDITCSRAQVPNLRTCNPRDAFADLNGNTNCAATTN